MKTTVNAREDEEIAMTFTPGDLDDVPALLFKRIGKRVADAEAALRRPSGVHEARKQLKKIRALLQLLRDVAGKRRVRRADHAFRDVGRPLSVTRDADAMIETLDALCRRSPRRTATLAALRPALVTQRRRVRRATLRTDEVAQLRAAIRVAADLLARWPDEHSDGGWPRVHEPFVETYRAARRALRRAVRKADDDEAWHECRKRAKDLRYQLECFAPLAPEAIHAIAAQAGAVADALGEDHDLAVLVAFAQESNAAAIDGAARDAIARRRTTRQDAAARIGDELFAEGPGAFGRRMHAYWRAFVRR